MSWVYLWLNNHVDVDLKITTFLKTAPSEDLHCSLSEVSLQGMTTRMSHATVFSHIMRLAMKFALDSKTVYMS